jgi:transposase
MATSNSIFRAIVTIFNNFQCHGQFKIMYFNIDQRISIIKWYYLAKEGRSGKTVAIRVQDHWRATYPNRLQPTISAIIKIVKKFERDGNLTNQHKNRSGRSKYVV